MRYYVGITHRNNPAPTPSALKLPPVSCFWICLEAESPAQAHHIAEPVLSTVIHPAQQEVPIHILTRRQWTAQIFADGEFPQRRYEVAEIVDGKPNHLREVLASSPHEAIEDVSNLLAELPHSTPPRLLQATLVATGKNRTSTPTKPRGGTPLETILAGGISE